MLKADSFGIVIFGASGDLTFRKLIPSLLHLYSTEQLGSDFYVIGCGRTPYDHEGYRSYLKKKVGALVFDDHEVDAK